MFFAVCSIYLDGVQQWDFFWFGLTTLSVANWSDYNPILGAQASLDCDMTICNLQTPNVCASIQQT